jgi:hypothetical protein
MLKVISLVFRRSVTTIAVQNNALHLWLCWFMSLSIIKYDFMIKSSRKRWGRYVVHTGEKRGLYRILVGNLRERDH